MKYMTTSTQNFRAAHELGSTRTFVINALVNMGWMKSGGGSIPFPNETMSALWNLIYQTILFSNIDNLINKDFPGALISVKCQPPDSNCIDIHSRWCTS